MAVLLSPFGRFVTLNPVHGKSVFTPFLDLTIMKNILFLFILFATPTLLRALPVEVISSFHTRLSGHTNHWKERLYVTGTVKNVLPGLRASGSYVEVDLLAADGRILDRARDQIGRPNGHPRLNRSGRALYTVSFPEALAAQAVSARVLFHNHSPGACPQQS